MLDSLIEGLAAAGHAAEIADLQAEAAARRSYRFCLFKQHIGRRIEPEARRTSSEWLWCHDQHPNFGAIPVMDAKSSPLPLGWYTPGGHPDFWSDEGTYAPIPYDHLPQVDSTSFNGSFAWLQQSPIGDCDVLDFDDENSPQQAVLASLAVEAHRNGSPLPDPFVTFLTNPDLRRRVATCTACYLSLSDRLIDVPERASGRLLRFMNDQQCVLLWYLYLNGDQVPAVVVGVPQFDDDANDESFDDAVRLVELHFCAPTFEEFMYRFWIENTIWYSLAGRCSLTVEQRMYLDAVRRVRSG